jgi:plasmid stabilization system protein ParE
VGLCCREEIESELQFAVPNADETAAVLLAAGAEVDAACELLRGIRSFHLRNAGADDPEVKVRRPVHALYYRVVRPDLVEIVRVLHERMEPSRHMGGELGVESED